MIFRQQVDQSNRFLLCLSQCRVKINPSCILFQIKHSVKQPPNITLLYYWILFFFPDIPASPSAQVVHSAGRRFIVSPVPEDRLKQLMFPTSPPPTTAPSVETGKGCLQCFTDRFTPVNVYGHVFFSSSSSCYSCSSSATFSSSRSFFLSNHRPRPVPVCRSH